MSSRRLSMLTAVLTGCVTAPDVTFDPTNADPPTSPRVEAITRAFSEATAADDIRAASLYRDVLLSRTATDPAYDSLLSIPDASWRAAAGALDELSGAAYDVDRVAILGSALRQPGTRSRAAARASAEITALTGSSATTESVDAARALLIAAKEYGQLGSAEIEVMERRLATARMRTDAADEAAAPVRLSHAEALAMVDRSRLQRAAPKTALGSAIVDAAALLELGDTLGERTTTDLLEPLRRHPKDTLASIEATLAELPLSARRDRGLLLALVPLVGSGAAVDGLLENELMRLSVGTDAGRAELLGIASALGRNRTERDRVSDLADRYVGSTYGRVVAESFGLTYEAALGTFSEHSIRRAESGCAADGCHWWVPVYNQNDIAIGEEWFPNGVDDSMLCSAATSAMVLAAALAENPPDATSTFVSDFAASTPPQRIDMMADALGTDPIIGGNVLALEPLLENGIDYDGTAPNVWIENDNRDLSPSVIQAELTRSPGVIVHYGKYTRQASVAQGPGFIMHITRYHRHGGHYVVVRGNSYDDFLINDPVHAQLAVDSLGTLHGDAHFNDDGSVLYLTILPNEEPVSYHWVGLQFGGEYRILNRALGIRNVGL